MSDDNKQINGERRQERRHATDFWSYSKNALIIISWITFLIALTVSYYAAPDKYYGGFALL